MKLTEIGLLILFAFGMGTGQLLLKYSSQRQAVGNFTGLIDRLIFCILDWPFVVAAVLYALMLAYWTWLLTFLPLSKAYPFTFLSLAIVVIGSFLFFSEQLTPKFSLGLVLVVAGLCVIAMDTTE
jgi:multidrug transporter EmrE-like cation transporter